MTDVTTLPDADAPDLAAGYVYLWVPGAPASQFKAPISDLASVGSPAGGTWKTPVRVAATANVVLATGMENGDTLDGVTLATGDRVLLPYQTVASQNGIYTVNVSGAPTRATDADSSNELAGSGVIVLEGTVNHDTLWLCHTDAPIIVGTTSLTWKKFISGSASITLALSDLTTALTTGTGRAYWDPPFPITISAVRATVFEAPTGSAIQIDINEAGSSILSTKITIDDGEVSSATAATPPVISDPTVTGRLTFDIDAIGSGSAGKGAQVTLEYAAA